MKPAAVLPAPPQRDPENFILPHNLEAERATLGAALLSSAAADYLADNLQREAYFRRVHGVVFEAIAALREQRTTVDLVTLRDELARRKKLDDVGGAAWLSSLTDGVPRSANVEHYAGILKDLQAKRQLVAYANRTIDLVASAGHSSAEILVDADRRLMDLQAGHVDGRMLSLAESSYALMQDLEWRAAHRGELTGIDTGFASINELTLGWQAGDLDVIGARPSIGKTTFVINSFVHGCRSGKRLAIFSMEMRRRQLEYRILAQLSGIPLTRILGGHVGDADYEKLSAAMVEMSALSLSIDDRAGQTFFDIRAACRRLKADGGLDGVAIDYVQLMSGTLERRGATRNDEITDISRRLKVLAGELEIPIILLSQLNRAAKDRNDPRPRLSDLRESGALEQDADIVAFLHRKNHREGGTTNFILEKQRNGPSGTVNLTLDRDITTFTDGGEDPPPETPKETKRTRKSS
jgi:replicative DNA helicase